MTHEEVRKELQISREHGHRIIFDNYFRYVYTVVYSRLRSCCSHEDIEECISDVFADIYLFYDTDGDFSGDISGFVGTIARRRAADVYRKHMSEKYVPVSLDDEGVGQMISDDNTEDEVSGKETRKMLLDRIEELGEPDSIIIIQKYFFGRSSKEISKFVSMTPSAVRVRCSRALKRLGKLLEKSGITI